MKTKNLLLTGCLITLVSGTSFAVLARTVEPDNSKVNESELANRQLNAEDQSNSKSDIKLTQSIRKRLMSLKSLSLNAKNVKIIAINGTVTLKGPVNSSDEKTRIEKTAKKVAGNDKVVNEIEVKAQ